MEALASYERRGTSDLDRMGDAYSFVLPGFWDSQVALVALVGACVVLLVEFPLFLRFR